MPTYNINTSNTSFLSEGEPVIYAGKNGFTTAIGSIPLRCSNVTSNIDSIVLTVDYLSLLFDDNYNTNVLQVPYDIGESNVYLKIPVLQYSATTIQEGSSGYYSQLSNLSLEIQSFNVESSTITVRNSALSTGYVSDTLLNTPFYTTISQTIKANNFNANCLYVTGTYKSVPTYANVTGLLSYTASLKSTPRDRNNIRVYLDDIRTDNFTWDLANPTVVTVPNIVDSTQLTVIVDLYTTPAIEENDLVSFSTFNNTYTIVGTSYQPSSNFYSNELTSNCIYKVFLDKPIVSDSLNYYIINISQDLEGSVANITSNSFSVDYSDEYPYTYNLANNNLYYLYQKNKVRYTTARLDEYGTILGLSPQNYIVEATTINRYNRTSATVKGLLQVEGIKLSKVTSIAVTERVFIDTTGGASISATIEFPTIQGRDVTAYEILYRVVSDASSTVPEYTRVLVNHDPNNALVRYTVNNLNRGTVAGTNDLEILVTPLNGNNKGYPTSKVHSLIGKQENPAGLSDFNVTQQGDSIIYTWQFAQTSAGYILDLDTKEVEIREYPGFINIADQETVNATWGISLIVDRIPFPNTTYTSPIAKYGEYTYFIRVRDTSNNESDKINASLILLERTISRIYKAYNETDPSSSFTTQDGVPFPNSNTLPEVSYPSFNDSNYNGFVYADSTNVDNSNGASSGFSTDITNPEILSTTNQPYAQYITQIRDVGRVIKGSIRIKPTISISTSTTYNDLHRSIIQGISDSHASDGIPVDTSILVDNAFGGIGTILGFNNANAAVATYNVYARTLTSGGPSGNVYAIRNTGQFSNDYANANMFAYIAGVVSANAIQLGEVFYANGRSTGSNSFANLCISGNSYELVDMAQFVDTAGGLTFLGPTRDIVQNVYVRYSTDNVFYSAAANGVVGYPGHGNTNPNAFSGADSNAALGFKRYISGDLDFRYFQIKLEYYNKEPDTTSILIENFTYEVDVQEKTYSTVKEVNNVQGVYVDYSFKNYLEPPGVTATIYNTNGGYIVTVSNVTSSGCNLMVYQSNTGSPVAGYNVAVTAIGI